MRFAAIEAALEKNADHKSRLLMNLDPVPAKKMEQAIAD